MPHEEVMPSGYDEEERYFHEHDLELLRKKRQQLDAERRSRQQEVTRQQHWMKCPKCGSDMQEVKMDLVMVDKCPECGGIYFDKGELELLLEAKKGFLKKLIGR